MIDRARRILLSFLSRREAGVRAQEWKRLRFSYSQHGEDIIAEALLPQEQGFYVDVGAFHPVMISNTYLFYRKGWSGIAIDAKPWTTSRFRRQRPRDIVVESAVGEEEGVVTFELMDQEGAGETDRIAGAGVPGESERKPDHTMQVTSKRLATILDQHLPSNHHIDFLTVDCEGNDLSVLRSNDWNKYRPRVIAVEDWEQESVSKICSYLSDQGYRLVITTKNTRVFSVR